MSQDDVLELAAQRLAEIDAKRQENRETFYKECGELVVWMREHDVVKFSDNSVTIELLKQNDRVVR